MLGVLKNPLYTGALVWGRARKRDDWGAARRSAKPEAEWVRGRDEALRIVPDALWEAAHERLTSLRAAYLRHPDGRLWGRPANGKASPYLLTGLAQCGTCGGALYVVVGGTRGRGRRTPPPRPMYLCATYKTRGRACCANTVGVPMAAADAAVLAAVDASVLDPVIVEAALASALAQVTAPAAPGLSAAERRAALAACDDQLARLAEACGLATGPLPALVQQMTQVHQQREALAATGTPPAPPPDPRTLRQALVARLADWQALLRRNVPQGRQLLRKLLVGRIVFTPTADGARFEADCSLGYILHGFACATPFGTRGGSCAPAATRRR